jgi:hypothetical protein
VVLTKAKETSALELMPQKLTEEVVAQKIVLAMMKNGEMKDEETAKRRDKIALQKVVSEIMKDEETAKAGDKKTEDAKAGGDGDKDGKPKRSTR